MPTSSVLERAVDLISHANPDVQAALVGNVGLFLGGVLTFLTAAFFAGRQFRHERVEKAKDRALELKKELLVDGIRGAQDIIGSINLAADLERPHSDASAAFQQGSRKLVAAATVAHIGSVSAGRDFLEMAGPALFRIMARRAPLEFRSSDINWWQEEINRQGAAIQVMLDELRAATVSGDGVKGQTLNDLLEGSRQICTTMSEENQVRRDALLPLRIDLGAAVLDEVIRLSEALDSLLAAVRKDIGVDAEDDTQAFLVAVRIDIQRMRAEHDKFLGEVREAAKEEK